jgi:hypothetical protein
MSVPMPAVLVLIVCKTLPGTIDDNSQFTHWESRPWAYENSMMVCRRQEIQLYDQAVDQGGAEQPLSPVGCLRAGPKIFTEWDNQHLNSPYRAWRYACPTPIIDTQTGEIVGWKLPDCGHQDTVICEQDSVI